MGEEWVTIYETGTVNIRQFLSIAEHLKLRIWSIFKQLPPAHHHLSPLRRQSDNTAVKLLTYHSVSLIVGLRCAVKDEKYQSHSSHEETLRQFHLYVLF